jgi:hypothetical protein
MTLTAPVPFDADSLTTQAEPTDHAICQPVTYTPNTINPYAGRYYSSFEFDPDECEF